MRKILFKLLRFLYPKLYFKFNVIENVKFCNKKVMLYSPYNIVDTTIGDYTYISEGSHISKTTIGNYCSIGPNLLCGWGIHPKNGITTSPMFYSTSKVNGFSFVDENKYTERKSIFIGHDVFIGANVIILDGITIGTGAIIGAGAVVSKNIPPYAIAVGSPIKVINYRFSKDIIKILLEINIWEKKKLDYSFLSKNFGEIEKIIEKYK